jgi:protoporphyrinogen oxidase
MGSASYKKIWEPLMVNKLGRYADDISLAWFWARVYKRTPSLAYPEGGFLRFAEHLEKLIKKQKGTFLYNTEVTKLSSDKKPVIEYKTSDGKTRHKEFDAVIVTLPSTFFVKIAPDLPGEYTKTLGKLKGIGAMNVVVRLKKPFLLGGTYWLNMCDSKSPILAIVEHTNFMDSTNYNNEHIVYLGNYMEPSDERFSLSVEELLKRYEPWLTKINSDYKKNIIGARVFKAPFAQPIIPPHYSKILPAFKTPLQNVYLANIEQVYPWDRGTNYAVELGQKITSLVHEK